MPTLNASPTMPTTPTTPRISLAMIVKDEEENLRNCLASVAKHVDEIVVVDTGSRDRTREVAVQFGANLYTFDHHTHPASFFMDDEATCRSFGFNLPGQYSNEIAFADFGGARAFSFEKVSGDYVFWVDADDVVEGAEKLRGIVDHMAANAIDYGFLPYDYMRDHAERTFYRQWRERIFRRDTGNWVNPVHEVYLPRGPIKVHRYEGQVLLVHRRRADRKQTPHRNYKILLRQLKQFHAANPTAPVDPRILFYLGQESRFVEPLKAIGFYEGYLKSSGWDEERAAAHGNLGQLYEFGQSQLPTDEALHRAYKEYAVQAVEMPDNPDGLFGLARIAKLRERWVDCVNFTERGLKIGNTDSMLGANPMDRVYRPHFYYNEALGRLGRLEDAIASCKAGLAVCPDDPGIPGGASGMLSHNVRFYEQELAQRRQQMMEQSKERPVVTLDKNEDLAAPPAAGIPHDALIIWSIQLWKQSMAAGDPTRALLFLSSLPQALVVDPVVQKMVDLTERAVNKGHTAKVEDIAKQAIELGQRAAQPRPEPYQPVTPRVVRTSEGQAFAAPALHAAVPELKRGAFWIGPAFEPWDPTTPNTKGIGGSESACIEMAKHFRRLGHEVTVYGDLGGTSAPLGGRSFDGVLYVDYRTVRTAIDCDVLIVSRVPQVMEHERMFNAKLRLLWVHDINFGPPSPALERNLYCFDRVLALSEFHRDHLLSVYPSLHPNRVLVTRNGIDPERFHPHVARLPKQNHMVFSSSPNRGLIPLLHNFETIRSRVPNAELHVYYGFDCWETLAKMRNDRDELGLIEAYKNAIRAAEQKGGVFWHGRVNQKELAEAFLRAKVWGYLTRFPETSCISAMEAQAAGCVPVVSRFGALAETVKHGVFIDPTGPDISPSEEAQWREACIDLLTNEPKRAQLADAGRSYALGGLSWAHVAAEWSALFQRLAAEVAANPIPMWRAS